MILFLYSRISTVHVYAAHYRLALLRRCFNGFQKFRVVRDDMKSDVAFAKRLYLRNLIKRSFHSWKRAHDNVTWTQIALRKAKRNQLHRYFRYWQTFIQVSASLPLVCPIDLLTPVW